MDAQLMDSIMRICLEKPMGYVDINDGGFSQLFIKREQQDKEAQEQRMMEAKKLTLDIMNGDHAYKYRWITMIVAAIGAMSGLIALFMQL